MLHDLAVSREMRFDKEFTVAQLCAAYRHGQRQFRGVEVVGEGDFPQLSDASLRDAEFVDCWFHSARFFQVDLGNTKFQGCNLKCASFERCDLSDSTWKDCRVCAIA